MSLQDMPPPNRKLFLITRPAVYRTYRCALLGCYRRSHTADLQAGLQLYGVAGWRGALPKVLHQSPHACGRTSSHSVT